jgi:hypothetical protein
LGIREHEYGNLRELYRACTVTDTKADFNGVLKSAAQQVNRDDGMDYIVHYMVGVTKKDDMVIGGEDDDDDDEGGEEMDDDDEGADKEMNTV